MKKITFLIVLVALLSCWYGAAQITSYPYSEDFEAGAGGWVATNGSVGTWALGAPTASVINSAASGANAWATNLSGNYNANENSFVQSPVFNLSTLAAPSIQFSIWWNSEFSWDGMVLQSSIDSGTSWQNVGAFEDPNNWYNDNTINGIPGGQPFGSAEGWSGRGDTGSNGWVVARHALIGLAGQSNVILRFAFGSDGSVQDNGVAFDLVTIFEVTCPEPSGLTVDSQTATTANISWTPGGSETAWEVAVQTAGTGVPTGSGDSTTSNAPYVATGLSPATNYEVYVRSACGSEFSPWVGPINFLTECISFTAPYSEGFENAGTIPVCWTMSGGEVWRFSNTGAGNHIGNNGTITGTTATNGYFAWVDSSGTDAPATLLSPMIDVSALTVPALSFYEISNNEGNANSTLTVDVWDGAAWNNVGVYNTNTSGWELKIIDLSALTITGDIQARFIFSETTASDFYDDIAIDDVQFNEAPLCIIPSGLTAANVTGTTADISWNGGTATAWEYVRQPAGTGVPSGNGTPLTVTTVNETGLAFSTSYEVFIRTDCGADGFSDWVGPLTFTTTIQTDFTVDCNAGPVNSVSCYDSDDDAAQSITFTSSDGVSALNIIFNSGNVENNFDELIVLDSDGTTNLNAATPYGAGGNVAGITYQSSGPSISFYVDADFTVSCQSSTNINPIDVTVTCATCVNPIATYTVRSDCFTGPQFFVDVDVTSLGSANSLTLTDNQGSASQTVSATGLVTFGPYPNATNVQITLTNDDDVNCVRTSNNLTQPFCSDTLIDCSAGPFSTNYCYENNDSNVFSYTSSDGTSLNLTIDSGEIEGSPFDFLVILDSDGVTELYNGEGNNGILTGLTFQSTGDTIFFSVTADSSISCASGSFTAGIDYTVACATCTNPAATYTVRSNCFTGPEFFVDVDVTSLGSANSVTLTDNQGSASQTVSATGLVTFGPYPNATDVQITITSDDDVNCVRTSNNLTQPFCLDTFIDCSVGPFSTNYCYENNDTNVFSYTSSDGSPLNLTINSGEIEGSPFDFLVILDSDGVTELYNGEGNNGNLTGLTFQSTGDTIFFSITSDSVISCASGSFTAGIDYTVACATCINPAATYTVIDDCANGSQFLIDVDITSLGDATSLTVTDNQGSAGVVVTGPGVVQMGPYPFATPIIITISNDQDVNCVINSSPIQVAACPPANDNCTGATVAVVNPGSTCDVTTPGTVLAATPTGVPTGSCAGNPDDDVWFQFTALNEVQLISLINITGGTTNLDHAVYSGSCGALTELYCSPNTASVTPLLSIGTTYFIRVFSGGSVPESSTFDLCIQQAPDNTICEQAANFCSAGGSSTGANVIGFPSSGSIACLATAPNPSWNIIQVGDPGLIEIEIVQISSVTGNGIDVDFVLWGPFDTNTDYCSLGLEVDCPSCPNNTSDPNFYPFGNIVDCSYDGAFTENLTIANAQVGEIYVLLVTNFSNQPGNITITQTNSGTTGAGSTVASIQVSLGGDQDLCGIDNVVLTANSPFADTYEWYADGFVIPGETDPTLTVTESNTYTVIVYDAQCDVTAQDTVTVTLGLEPDANPVPDLVTCDDISGDDVEEFDLESQTATILGTQDPALFNVTYHLSQSDAITNTGALTSPYTNVTNPQQIWVRIEDANAPNCIAITSFNLIISGATPTATSANIEVCDDPSEDGFESFDLTANDVNILNGQSAADFSVTYYETEADADAAANPLTSPYTNTTNPQTIWARVDNNAAVDCYAIASFDLIVSPPPTANASPDLAGCDTDDNGTAEYDLTTNESVITGGVAGVTVTYYTTSGDADAGTSAIGNPTDFETGLNTIYVRVEDSGSGCYNVMSFNLTAGEVPVTSFTSDFDYQVCPDATTPIIITATPENYTLSDVSIVWYQDGGLINGQTGLTLPVLTQGFYEIQVTFNDTGCTDTTGQQVIELSNCVIPQGISPDGDGKNDTFDLSNFNVTRIEIFNRYGRLVYSKDNYIDEWRGQTDNGDELPVGTYFYTMIYEGGAKQYSSWVYINK